MHINRVDELCTPQNAPKENLFCKRRVNSTNPLSLKMQAHRCCRSPSALYSLATGESPLVTVPLLAENSAIASSTLYFLFVKLTYLTRKWIEELRISLAEYVHKEFMHPGGTVKESDCHCRPDWLAIGGASWVLVHFKKLNFLFFWKFAKKVRICERGAEVKMKGSDL